jgi:hypothetical protein
MPRMTDLLSDIRTAIRISLHARWSTLAIVLTLALGTGVSFARRTSPRRLLSGRRSA